MDFLADAIALHQYCGFLRRVDAPGQLDGERGLVPQRDQQLARLWADRSFVAKAQADAADRAFTEDQGSTNIRSRPRSRFN